MIAHIVTLTDDRRLLLWGTLTEVGRYLDANNLEMRNMQPLDAEVVGSVAGSAPDRLATAAADLLNVTIREVRGRRRTPPLIRARVAISHLLKNKLNLSHGQISDTLNKDRNTVKSYFAEPLTTSSVREIEAVKDV